MAALTEEQTILRDQTAAWAKEKAPVAAFRKMRDAGGPLGYDVAIWQEIVDLGLPGVVTPEAAGGTDMGFLAFGVALEELGRELVASPLLASGLAAASVYRLACDDVRLQAVAEGRTIATLAVDEGPRHAPDQSALTANAAGGGYRLNGAKTFVMEGMAADEFIVSADVGGGTIGLFVVPATAAGLSREPMEMIDSRGHARIELKDVDVGGDAELGGFEVLEGALDRARAGMAAEMLGTGAAAFDLTMDYLKNREQFGRVIGSFQTLGHRAAELFTAMEMARSCGEAALQALDANDAEASRLCSLAKAKVGDFLFQMSNQLIQIHGGLGMTDEFDAGLYLKRARVQEATFGGRAFHRDRYARLMGY